MNCNDQSRSERRGRIGVCLFFAAIFFFSGITPARAGWLYLLNDDSAGSRIYGFQVNEATGALTLLGGFPVNAQNGGINSIVSERMVADAQNNRLYVVNDGSDTVSAYSINSTTGAITPLPFSPIALGAGVWNTIAVHPSGSPLIVANNALNGVVQSWNITPTTATQAAGSPFPMTGAAGFSSEFSVDGNYYYVGGNSGNNVAGYSVNPATGVLTTLSGSPFNSGAAQPLAHATDAAGRFYAVSSTNEVRVFTSSSGNLSPVTGNPFASGLSARRFGLIHPNQNFYIVAGNTGNNVGVYQIMGSGAATTVAAVSGSPFATGGTTANVLATSENGNFLFVGNRISRNVTTFAVNTITGQLTSLGVQPSNTLGTVGAINGVAFVPDAFESLDTIADFDGDGKTDLSVFRPSEGNWYINRSFAGFLVQHWGAATDTLTPADYDGDGKTDIAVWREVGPDGVFYILNSSTGTTRIEAFGLAGDLPTVGDWDGDTKADISVYRNGASAGLQSTFFYRGSFNNPANGITYLPWGLNGDQPLNGDFDGDDKRDLAVYRASNNTWYIRQSSNGLVRYELWGVSTDRRIPADFDGDDRSDLAVWRPSTGTWIIRNSFSGSTSFVPFGISTDIPVAGDYDGDGRDDVAVYRNGTWHRVLSFTSSYVVTPFGLSTDVPVPAAYFP